MLQAQSVGDAAFGCDWVGAPIPFQRCLIFIISTANKEFQLTAGKFVPVSNVTMMNVCNMYVYICMCVCMKVYINIYKFRWVGTYFYVYVYIYIHTYIFHIIHI